MIRNTIILILIVTVMTVNSKRILMSCAPLYAHQEIMLFIAKELKNRNHTILFSSYPNYKQRIESIGLEYIEMGDLEDSKRTNSDPPDSNTLESMGLLVHKVADLYENTYTKSLEVLKNRDIDYVFADMFVIGTLDAARQLNKKYSIIYPSGFLSFAGYEDVNYVAKPFLPGPLISMHSIYQRFYDNYMLPAIVVYYSLPEIIRINNIRKKYGVGQYLGLTDAWKNHLVISTSFFGMEYARPILPTTVQVGPVISNEDMNVQISGDDIPLKKWLDIDEPIIYIAFGSLVALKEWQLKSILAGVSAIQGTRVLVALRETLQKQLNFDASVLPEQFRVESWVNQKMVLAHKNVKVFLTHGGYMSISEAMFSHKPMLVLPFFGDQPGNAVRLVEAGAGLKLEIDSFTPEDVSQKLQQLLTDNKYTQNMKKLHRIAMYNGGAKKAADAIELDMDVGIDHLITITDQFSFIEIGNYDIKCIALIITCSIVWLLYRVITRNRRLKVLTK
jgi:UDP:flavonoid glycosyltransferase YjiC (YdhE family)